MGQVKPWQIVLIIVALAAAGTSAYLTLGGAGTKLNDGMLVADVTSGELFSISFSGHKAYVFPLRNPDTGKLALLPVLKGESGSWTISPRHYLESLAQIEGDPKAVVDRKSGEVKITSETPKPIK